MSKRICNFLIGWIFLLSSNVYATLDDITRIYQQTPALNSFDICIGGGCAAIKHLSLNHEEWQRVTEIFYRAGSEVDAKQERQLISMAIGELEKIVGDKTDTAHDLAGTFHALTGQLDCNDEAINSTTYMRLMRLGGLIKLHEVEDMRTRNFFFNGWPHSTAVMHEIATGERFAVDSWFYDNGYPATVVPFALWKSGYIPEDSPIVKEASTGQKKKDAR